MSSESNLEHTPVHSIRNLEGLLLILVVLQVWRNSTTILCPVRKCSRFFISMLEQITIKRDMQACFIII